MEFKFDLQMFAAPTVDVDYQLRWDAVDETGNGVVTAGLIPVTVSTKTSGTVTTYTVKGTVAEQTAFTTFALPKSGTKYYLQVQNSYDEATGMNTLTVVGLEIATSTGVSEVTWDANNVLSDKSAITITAPTSKLTFDATIANYPPVTINKVAAGSVVALKAGDEATTGTLTATDTVKMNGIVYTAATSGTLKFVGEDDGNGGAASAALLSGNITVVNGGPTATIAGTSKVLDTDSITVETTDTTGVTVKVSGGKITSITGLEGSNKAVTVTDSGVSTIYTSLNAEGTMISKAVGGVTTYLDLTKPGGEVYKATYKAAKTYDVTTTDWATAGKKVMYYNLAALGTNADADTLITQANLEAHGEWGTYSTDHEAGIFQPGAGQIFAQVTTQTTNGVTTISSVDFVQAAANGELKKISNYAYTGTLNLSSLGTQLNGEVISYKKPANANFTVTTGAGSISYKSTLSNLGTGDLIETTALNAEAVTKGTYTLYHINAGVQETSKVTVVGNGVTLTAEDATVTKLASLYNKGEKVTIENHTAAGMATTIYEATADGKVKRTVTTAAGAVTIDTATVASDADIMAAGWTTNGISSYNSTFDWTLSKNTTGYFKVSSPTAAVTAKAGTTKITKAGETYLAVELDDDNGKIKQFSLVTSSIDEDGVMSLVASAVDYTGKLTITAPSGVALTALDTTGDPLDTAAVTINGLAASSKVTIGVKDKVTTASLNAGDTISVDGGTTDYVAGVKGTKLTFAGVDTDADGTLDAINLTAGTVRLTEGGMAAIATAGGATVTVTSDADDITVTGGTKTFSVGDLDDGDTFNVGAQEYVKFGTAIYSTDDAANNIMYTLGTKTSISSTDLDITNTKKWAYRSADVSDVGVVTVDLALADKRIAADTKADIDNDTYEFGLDKFVTEAAAAKLTEKSVRNATVDVTADVTYQTKLGTVTKDTTSYAAEDTAQTIKAAAGWTVAAGAADTTIIGASKGADTLIGNTGDDTFTLSGAEDTVYISEDGTTASVGLKGADTITGYTSGKDKIVVTAVDTKYTLSTSSNDVYISNGDYVDGATTDYVLLKGVGGGKAVSISADGTEGSYVDHYFGNGKTATTGGTFTYVEGAYYHGNGSGKNVLKVNTIKGKATKTSEGLTVEVDLTADTGKQYENITTVNASASANAVKLTAADADANGVGSTLMGGTYVSELVEGTGADTLVGGSGVDTFQFGAALAGKDTVKSYTNGKDVLAFDDGVFTVNKLSVDGNNVVITEDADNNITVVGAVNAAKALYIKNNLSGATTSYYVGKTGTNVANTFTYEDGAVYVGNASTTAESSKYDTLKVAVSVTAKNEADYAAKLADTANPSKLAEIDLGDYVSIDAVDASGVSVAAAIANKYGTNNVAKTGGVTIATGAAGARITGSKYNDVITLTASTTEEDYITYKTGQGADTINDFGVGDVIQLNGLSKTDIANLKAAAADTTDSSTAITAVLAAGFTSGGSLTVAVDGATKLTYDAAKNQIVGSN